MPLTRIDSARQAIGGTILELGIINQRRESLIARLQREYADLCEAIDDANKLASAPTVIEHVQGVDDAA